MVKITSTETIPVSIRIRELKPGQVALQVNRAIVWTRVGNHLLFTERDNDTEWHHAPSNNAKIFVNPYPPHTEVTFASVA